jgi:hypothetical protein
LGCLFHKLDFSRPPLLCEERFERTVEAQDRKPTLAGDRLSPVAAFDTFGLVSGQRKWWSNRRRLLLRQVMNKLWLPARGKRCGVSSIERDWLS